jgi:hypothetical protein
MDHRREEAMPETSDLISLSEPKRPRRRESTPNISGAMLSAHLTQPQSVYSVEYEKYKRTAPTAIQKESRDDGDITMNWLLAFRLSQSKLSPVLAYQTQDTHDREDTAEAIERCD